MNEISASLKKTITLVPSGLYSFEFARTRYMIPPWYEDGVRLIRILRDNASSSVWGVMINADHEVNTQKLFVEVYANENWREDSISKIEALLINSLHLESPIDQGIIDLAKNDAILNAAIKHNGWNRGKAYPSLFEAICGVICAQRSNFSRVSTMMGKMSQLIGPKVIFPDNSKYSGFPVAEEIVDAGIEALKNCSLGFRAKRIFDFSREWLSKDYSSLETNPPDNIQELLVALPGVGPYTANLATNLTSGFDQKISAPKPKEPHIDSYVKAIFSCFYLDGKYLDDQELKAYIINRWGPYSETIVGLLTTDTEEWALELGFQLPVKSGAKAQYRD